MKVFTIDIHASVRHVDTIPALSREGASVLAIARLEAFRKLAKAHGFEVPTFNLAVDEEPITPEQLTVQYDRLGLPVLWNKDIVVTHLDPAGHLRAANKETSGCTCPVQSRVNRALRGPLYDPHCPVHPAPVYAESNIPAPVHDHGCCDDPDCPSNS